jgi:hypothetical protein
MSDRLQLSRQSLRAGAGFHPDQCWLSPFKESKQRVTAELDSLDYIAGRISTDNVEDILTQIDSVHRCVSQFIPNRLSPPLVGASG